jgi:uncharacterized protein
MTTLAGRQAQLPFPAVVTLGSAVWLAAWLVNLPLANWAAYDLLGLERGTQFADAVAFFLLDVPKVLLLLTGIVTLVSFLRSFVSPERVRRALAGRGVLPGTMAAAGFGVVTPFCSCSAVPLFIGFVEAGVPLGVTFAFLVASPMVNEVALVLLWGLFGPGIALAYMAAGLTVAIVAGLVIGRLGLERYVEDYVWTIHAGADVLDHRPTLEERVRDAWRSAVDIVRRVLPYVVAGIGVGALIPTISARIRRRSTCGISRAWWSALSSMATSRRIWWSRSAVATTRWPSRSWSRSGRPCTATRRARSRSSKHCSGRASRSALPSRS